MDGAAALQCISRAQVCNNDDNGNNDDDETKKATYILQIRILAKNVAPHFFFVTKIDDSFNKTRKRM